MFFNFRCLLKISSGPDFYRVWHHIYFMKTFFLFMCIFQCVPYFPCLVILTGSSPLCDPHPKSSETYRNCLDNLASLLLPIICWPKLQAVVCKRRFKIHVLNTWNHLPSNVAWLWLLICFSRLELNLGPYVLPPQMPNYSAISAPGLSCSFIWIIFISHSNLSLQQLLKSCAMMRMSFICHVWGVSCESP